LARNGKKYEVTTVNVTREVIMLISYSISVYFYIRNYNYAVWRQMDAVCWGM